MDVSNQLVLALRPKLLFLDEPTSRLDSAASYHVMNRIVQLAKQDGRTVVASIHQPSWEVFELFHNLYLLSSGRTVYTGSISAANEDLRHSPGVPSSNRLECVRSYSWRSFVNMYRDLGYYWLRFAIYIALCLCVGTIFHDIGHNFGPIQFAEMVHFRDYKSPSSKNKYLLIEADDGIVLTRLLTETPITGNANRLIKVWTLRTPNQRQLNIASTLPCLGRRILKGDIRWGNTMEAFFEACCPTTNTLLTSAGELSISVWDLYKIGGLPIRGLPYEEVVPKAMELTGIDEKHERFILCFCEFLFVAFQHLQEGETSNPRVPLSKWIKFWCKRILRYDSAPLRKEKKSARLKLTHNPTGTIPKAAKWLSLDDGTFRVAAMMADKQIFSLAVPVLSNIYNGLNRFYKSLQLEQLKVSFPIHYVYGWIANYFKMHFPLSNGPSIPLMTAYSGEGGAMYFDGERTRKCIHQGDSPIINTPQKHGEEVPTVVKPPILKSKVKGSLHIATQKEDSPVLAQQAFNKRPPQDESENSHGDRCWKKVKPSLAKKGTLDNVQILEDPLQSKPKDSSESVAGPDSRELLLSSKEALLQIVFFLSKMASKSYSMTQDLLGSFFGMAASYDQAQSVFVDKIMTIKESEPYLKVKEHFELVLRERDEKSEEVSITCTSLENARKKVKKLKACRDAAKQEVIEMESKVSADKEEFSKCSDVSLDTAKASKVVEKKKQVLEAALQDLVNYKLYLD
ncbi:hypothetical protein FXO38_11436 [Capsicum annuum]|nr:hypothetical protein FXO37_27197 [Capsicum annuum]KAF3661900.1 hypothetical protein FXO38_11436 [Capsicum annuum]